MNFSSHSYAVEPIGFITTRFRHKYDAPHQIIAQNTKIVETLEDMVQAEHINNQTRDWIGKHEREYLDKQASIELLPHKNFEQALADIEGFERLWLVYVFHSNVYDGKPHWKPKVLPPRGRVKRGVFATRAPYRPNPLGISVVRLISVQGLTLHVGECDVLDGTPILDIKPYIPLYDSFPESRTGWLEELDERLFTCEYSSKASLQLASANLPTLDETLRRVLSIDPFPHPYRRIRVLDKAKQEYEYAYQTWRVRYFVDMERRHILITSLFNTAK